MNRAVDAYVSCATALSAVESSRCKIHHRLDGGAADRILVARPQERLDGGGAFEDASQMVRMANK